MNTPIDPEMDDLVGGGAGARSHNASGAAGGGRGGTGGGGSGGNAGRPLFVAPNENCAIESPSGEQPLIDDLEDGDVLLPAYEGRDGDWWLSGDGSVGAEQTLDVVEIPGGREDSAFAIHTSGSGLSIWGAVLGIDLRSEAPDEGGRRTECAYDASRYAGLRFWARGRGERVRVKGTMIDHYPVASGGICAAEPADDCWNDHGFYVTLAEDWTEYQIPFAELEQSPGWGIPLDFDASHLQAIRFQTDAGVDFDYWIDDLRFYAAEE